MKKEKVCYAALGGYLDELRKHAGLTNDAVCEALELGHDILNDLKKGWIAH